ncbi:MAG: Gfo/Idh/MocA family oxidoreductase [Spirochaetes bacterium]|nr:Gfo/Idh/MocA family oxidoreductase [Spirochaetota bacterium]
MSERTINMAVIGCGIIGEVHAWAVVKSGKAKLVCTCDIQPSRAEAFAKKYNCRAETDYRRVLADPSIDAIAIGTPHCEHTHIFLDAIKAGKHVICEKPLSTTPDNIYAMIDAAKKSPLVTTGVFQHRFSPITSVIMKHLSAGALGKITGGSLTFQCRRAKEYYASDPWRGKWKFEGGGLLINQAIHTIDALTLFFGKPVAVSGHVERRHMDTIEVEDFAEGVVEYQNGVKVKLLAENITEEKWDPTVRIDGTGGSLTFAAAASHRVLSLTTKDASFRPELDKAELEEKALFTSAPGKQEYGSFHDLQFMDFINAVIEGRRARYEIESMSIANEIVLGLYHATATGKRTEFPISGYKQPELPLTPKKTAAAKKSKTALKKKPVQRQTSRGAKRASSRKR